MDAMEQWMEAVHTQCTPSFSLLVKVHSAYFMNDMDLPSTIFFGSHVDMNPKNG